MKFVLIMCNILFFVFSIYATPVSDNGQLKVKNGKLTNSSGNIVHLRGMSLFWNCFDNETFWEPWVIKKMAINWNMNIVRLPLGTSNADEKYYYDASTDDAEMEKMVDAAIDAGIYVIIDWHGHYASNHLNDAKAFFSKMAKKYGDIPNVIYEVWNEPITTDWTGTIRPYAESVLSEIRKYDPDNIVIVGTGFYCQQPTSVIGNEVKYNGSTDPNVMYAIHEYAASHDNLYSPFNSAVNAGLPLFMSEWGTCQADGGGSFDQSKSDAWVNWMESNNISWCNWSLFNKDEAASALKPLTDNSGDWTSSDLTESGTYIFNKIKNLNPIYVNNTKLAINESNASGKYIYLAFNKSLQSISKSDFNIDGYNISSVELKGVMDDEILITLDAPIGSDAVDLSVNVQDVYGISSLNQVVNVSVNKVELPLRVNVGENQSRDVTEFGYVKENPYEDGKSTWGTTWYDAHGGSDKTSLYSDFYEDAPQLDEIMGTYMYGFKSLNVTVASGTYNVYIFALDDRIVGPTDNKFGYHAFNVIAENDTVVKNFDAYIENNNLKYKIGTVHFTKKVTDGILNIQLSGISDYPMVSAIVVGDENYQWEYASILSNEKQDKKFNVSLFPNPFNPNANLSLTGLNKGNLSVKVYDINGRLVKEISSRVNDGNRNLSLKMSAYSSGIYNIVVKNGDKILNKKAILLK